MLTSEITEEVKRNTKTVMDSKNQVAIGGDEGQKFSKCKIQEASWLQIGLCQFLQQESKAAPLCNAETTKLSKHTAGGPAVAKMEVASSREKQRIRIGRDSISDPGQSKVPNL